MDSSYVTENNRSRERLQKLVKDITDEELQLVIYTEGWTIAVVLGHLSFWDERRLSLVKYWQEKEVVQSDISGVDMHTVNDALVPFFQALPPRKLAELAVITAEKLDKELETLPPQIIKAVEAFNEPFALNRGLHRKMHLDEIDVLLRAKRGGK